MKLDSAEARKALADIDDIVRRVRQSRSTIWQAGS